MDDYLKESSQLLKSIDPHGAHHLQEELLTMTKSARAIRGIGNCLSGVNRIDPKDRDGDFSYFNEVSCCDLEIAIDLLAKMTEDKGNNLCRLFGLTSDS